MSSLIQLNCHQFLTQCEGLHVQMFYHFHGKMHTQKLQVSEKITFILIRRDDYVNLFFMRCTCIMTLFISTFGIAKLFVSP